MTGHFICENGHRPEWVTVNVVSDPDGIGVLVGGDGDVTNRWADGVAGLPDYIWDEAQDETEGSCHDCHGIATWVAEA